jgi:hypothetical protein
MPARGESVRSPSRNSLKIRLIENSNLLHRKEELACCVAQCHHHNRPGPKGRQPFPATAIPPFSSYGGILAARSFDRAFF